jgi:hypothetical protein
VEQKPNQTKEREFILEVYGEQLDKSSQHYKNLVDLLRNRIVFVKQSQEANEKYEKLSNMQLFNKHNNSLIKDDSFSQNFNPLKYNLVFYAKTTKVYRIDSDWLLVINPQIIKE